MLLNFIQSSASVMQVVTVLACFGALISAIEGLASIEHFGPGQIFDWDVLRSRAPSFVTGISAAILDQAMKKTTVRFVFFGRIAAAIALGTITVAGGPAIIAAAYLLTSALYLNIRSPYGLDGSDQMSILLFTAITVNELGSPDTVVTFVCLWFIALQGTISYAAAGIAKLVSPVWRSGDAVRLIIDTEAYGSPLVARLAKSYPNAARVVTWSTIFFECAFATALLVGANGAIILALWAIVFHAVTALVMGLNNFVWSFVAVQPPIVFCAYQVQHWVSGSI